MNDPDSALARAFQAIDDPQERSKNLTGLIDSLSPWEHRHARLQLGDRDGLTRFEDLPADLVCLILHYLHIEDVLACAATSTKCRATWTEPSVAAAMSLRFFPALQPPFNFSAFRAACRKYLRRRAGDFTSRLTIALPFPHSNPDPQVFPQDWERQSRRTFRPDPVLHPDGKYPGPWLDMRSCSLECYGGGNLVFLAHGLDDYFVIDSLYTRTRKVVRIPGETRRHLLDKVQAAASKSLVVLPTVVRQATDNLVIFNLETNTFSHYNLPSHLESIVVRERRILAVMSGMQICVLDHDGSRVLTKFHFMADKGLSQECPAFSTKPGPVIIYPHPHLQDRFFAVITGWLDAEAQLEGIASQVDAEPGEIASIWAPEFTEPPSPSESNEEVIFPGKHNRMAPRPASDVIVREFDGQTHVATYHQDRWKSPASGSRSARFKNKYLRVELDSFGETDAIMDSQGSCGIGWWSVSSWQGLNAAGLPPLPEGFSCYRFDLGFNLLSKEFGVQRHLVPKDSYSRWVTAPWNQQDVILCVPKWDVLEIGRFDADEADFAPTRVSRSGTRGEREVSDGCTIEADGLMNGPTTTGGEYRFYNDEDFSVLFLNLFNRVYVWSYEEGEGETGSGSTSEDLSDSDPDSDL